MVWVGRLAERVASFNVTTPREGRVVDQYVGEIKLVGFNFAPIGWALCAGQILAISQNAALFSLLGTMYGGNGSTNFGLPDLQGRAGGHVGPNLFTDQGMKLGTETVTVTLPEYPAHSHAFNVSATAATQPSPTPTSFLATTTPHLYTPAQGATLQPLYNGVSNPPGPPVIGYANGGSQPHENMQPYQVLTYVIAMQGVFPARG
jgi:microcystin-dependent protein